MEETSLGQLSHPRSTLWGEHGPEDHVNVPNFKGRRSRGSVGSDDDDEDEMVEGKVVTAVRFWFHHYSTSPTARAGEA